MNLPNQITVARLGLAIVFFVLLGQYDQRQPQAWLLDSAWALFVVAAATDFLDGYIARKYGLVTTLGRILDPFADKVIICGTFIFLAAVPKMIETPWGLRAWMVVVIVGRELLVTALRSFLEERGADFSAKTSGKLKMALQCVAAALGLFYLSFTELEPGSPTWLWVPTVAAIWAAVILTVYSGLIYVFMAVKLLRQ